MRFELNLIFLMRENPFPLSLGKWLAESKGVEPYTLAGTSRLAGGPSRRRGLLSIVLMAGYDPALSTISAWCFPD
jgi:hypothetical protein